VGDASVEADAAEQLADALVLAPQELRWVLEEFLGPSDEFGLLGRGKRIVYRGSSDSFLEWIVHGRHDDN
jgi:hypothetical protein